MAVNYEPISGVDGIIYIGSYEYPCSFYNVTFSQSSVELPSAASYPYTDIQPGMMRCELSANGIARKQFNPNAGNKSAKAGEYKNILLVFWNEDEVQKMRIPSCYIESWHWTNESFGCASWSFVGRGDYKFTQVNES